MTNKNLILQDPLKEKALPLFAEKLGINHWSSTQFNSPDGAWFYKYIVLDQLARRLLFKSNSAMEAGKRVGDALQNHYADIIWRLNPQTNKIVPVEHKKIDLASSIEEQIEIYKEYQPQDDKDADKKFKYIDEIRNIIVNANDALNQLAVTNPVTCERQISIPNNSLGDFPFSSSPLLSVVGRIDFDFGNHNVLGKTLSKEVNPTGNLPAFPHKIIELKTKYSRLGKVKKDGTRSFLVSSSPVTASFNHCVQCAVYAAYYNFQVPVFLVYSTNSDYKIFDSTNCHHLTVEGMKRNLEIMFRTLLRREKILSLHQDLTREEIIEKCVELIEPAFDHAYAWSDLPPDLLLQAKELWKVA